MTILNLTASLDADAQNMYKNLADDIIQAVGTEFYYLPKERADLDLLLREDKHRAFKNAYIIEGYVKDKERFVSNVNSQTKYGIDYREYLTLCITRRRFHEVMPIEFIRPRTGDLIYSPIYKGVFTINYTEHEFPFYQLQQLTFYELYLERYVHNQDTLETGVQAVDNIQYKYGYQIAYGYDDMVGTFAIGDKVNQIFSGVTITGKIASIDTVNKIINITDITSTNEINITFISSETALVYDITNNTKRFEIIKVYDVDDTLPTQDTKYVIPNSNVAMNQELEKDVEDYIAPIPKNPFWG